MEASTAQRAIHAARSVAASLDLAVEEAVVLHDSNRLTLRLRPSDVVARVTHDAHEVAQLEVQLAQRLAEAGCPVATLDPRVAPLVYEQAGFAVTLWTYYEPRTPRDVSPADYAAALQRLHAGMRTIDLPTPHFTDRVEHAQQLVASQDRTPDLADADRALLDSTLRSLRQAIGGWGGVEQLLHGEPHPGNVLATEAGAMFIDLETCCRGPVEFDLAHAPADVGQHYLNADLDLLRLCRTLVLAMVTTWRWDRNDRLPDGRRLRTAWLSQLQQVVNGRQAS